MRIGVETDGADQVDQLTEAPLVQARLVVVPWENAPQARVLVLDGVHRLVQERTDLRVLGGCLESFPSGLGWDPEDVLGAVLVGVFGIGAVGDLGEELLAACLERIGDVLQEDESQDDVLVLGRVEVASQLVGSGPERLLEAQPGAVAVALGGPALRHDSQST